MLQPTHLFPLILAIAFGAIVTVFWLIFSTFRRVKLARMQSELHSKLIDKIGSSQEFLTYLDSDAGKRLVASISLDPPRREPYSRILRSVHTGVILLALGIAFLTLGTHFTKADDGFFFDSFFFFGGLAVALGAGFLISAGVSYRLSKKFGLLDRERNADKLVA
jgi:ABC-type multidrug transport system fused ATPase/permease subunit